MPNLHSTVINRNLPAWLSGETANFEAQSLTLKATDFAEVIKKYNGVPSGYPVTRTRLPLLPLTLMVSSCMIPPTLSAKSRWLSL